MRTTPPRSYQSLRTETAQAANQPAAQTEQQASKSAPQVPAPTRPNQVRAPSPGWTDEGGMPANNAAASRYHKWSNANAVGRQSAQPNIAAGVAKNDATYRAEQAKHAGRRRLDSALKGAKESKTPEPGHDPGRSR